MTILGWILFGFIVGLLARAIMPGNNSMGLMSTTLLGIAGALIAGWFGQVMGWYAQDETGGFISATIGAILVLAVYYKVVGSRNIVSSEPRIGSDDRRNAA